MLQSDKDILIRYIPPKAIDAVWELIMAMPVQIKIVNARKCVHGSYRRPLRHTSNHIITVNNNLNPYAFLITLLHEIAHMHACVKSSAIGHGKVWKNCFMALLRQFLALNVFPSDIQYALSQHLQNIKSSDSLDIYLTKILQKYDPQAAESPAFVFLEDFPENAVFLHGERLMEKKQLMRKYYVCRDIKTNKLYRCHPLLKVVLAPNEKG
jgi:hypothetical protein